MSDRRSEMVRIQLAGRDIEDKRVLEAMSRVPRHELVPGYLRDQAYEDHPLPIGNDQTISQPYIVALMTQLAELQPGDRVLEVGTGSGYQAAVLAELVSEVYTIEIVEDLYLAATRDLERLGYKNIWTRLGDGYQGWSEAAPFDAILVTAAAPRVPAPLADQLAEGGRLVIPVGPPGSLQTLVVYEKSGSQLRRRNVTAVRFVPMTGQAQVPPR